MRPTSIGVTHQTSVHVAVVSSQSEFRDTYVDHRYMNQWVSQSEVLSQCYFLTPSKDKRQTLSQMEQRAVAHGCRRSVSHDCLELGLWPWVCPSRRSLWPIIWQPFKGGKIPLLVCSLPLAYAEREEYGIVLSGRENEKAFLLPMLSIPPVSNVTDTVTI